MAFAISRLISVPVDLTSLTCTSRKIPPPTIAIRKLMTAKVRFLKTSTLPSSLPRSRPNSDGLVAIWKGATELRGMPGVYPLKDRNYNCVSLPSPSPPTAALTKQVRQLGDVRRDAPRLVARHQSRRRSPTGLLLEIGVGERLPVVIADDEAGRRSPRRTRAAGSGAASELAGRNVVIRCRSWRPVVSALGRCAIKRPVVADRPQEKAPLDGRQRGFSDRLLTYFTNPSIGVW